MTISVATNRRHFYLKRCKCQIDFTLYKIGLLDANSTDNINLYYGGSIYINTGANGGELNLFTIIMFNNKAVNGGIYSSPTNNAVITMFMMVYYKAM